MENGKEDPTCREVGELDPPPVENGDIGPLPSPNHGTYAGLPAVLNY